MKLSRALWPVVVVGIMLAVEPRARSGSTPATRAPAVASDRCETCHPAETAEWQRSRHAQAWTDAVFQSEFAHGRPAWCVGCHAPLAPDPTSPDDADPRVASGVACDACHRRGDRFVSSRRGALSPHATVVDPTFGSPDFCARCHEFNFPILGAQGRLVRYTDEPMQTTVSQARGGACLDCHDSPARHSFTGSHDPAYVAAALDVTLCRTGRSQLAVALTNTGAAHNVPSGGVHRRIVLRAWRSNAPERFAELTLGRRFRALDGGGKKTIADTTIAPNATRTARFELASLGSPRGEREINIELRYIYALDEHAKLTGDVSHILWQRRVDPGTLPRCR